MVNPIKPTLQVSLIETDCGCYTTGNTFSVFGVLVDGKMVSTVTVRFDEGRTTADCERGDEVPLLAGAVHVIAIVLSTIMKHFTSDHEFYCDVFSDDEGESKLLTIEV